MFTPFFDFNEHGVPIWKNLFSFFLLSLEVSLLATDVDWLLLVESLMLQMTNNHKTKYGFKLQNAESCKLSSYSQTSQLFKQGLLDLEYTFWEFYISKMLLNCSMHLFLPQTLSEDSSGFQSHSNSSQSNGPKVISTWSPILLNESYSMVFTSLLSY